MRKPLTAKRMWAGIAAAGAAAAVALWLGLALGAHPLDWAHIQTQLHESWAAGGVGQVLERATERHQPDVELAILAYRIRRALLAFCVGAALSVAGVGLQAVLRNPLADPYILGVSGGAALGAALVIVMPALSLQLLGHAVNPGFASLPVGAFAGGLLASLAVVALAARGGGSGLERLLLVGVVLNFLFSAGIMVLVWLGDPAQKIGILYWLMGNLSFSGASLRQILGLLCLVTALSWALWQRGRDLDLLVFGRVAASRLGVPVRWTQGLVVAGASLLTGLAVALAGLVGFIGLVVPHAFRRLLGPDHRLLVPGAFLLGGAFLVLCDLGARSLSTEELPVGVITALVGGPIFLWLLRREVRL